MGFLAIFWDLLMWGIGIFCTVIVFGVGMLFSVGIYGGASFLGNVFQLKLNRSIVDFVIRTLVFIAALVFCFRVKLPVTEVIQSLFTIGTFEELAIELASRNHMFLLNNVISVTWGQFILVFIFFLPYFFVTEAINLIKFVFCDEHESLGYSFISFVPELMTLFATNVVVIFFGDFLAMHLLDFVKTINIQYGLLTMLFNMLLFCFYVYRVVCDLFGSDVFLTMFGANIALMIVGAPTTGGVYAALIVLCYVLGYISKSVRNAVLSVFSALNHAVIVDGYSVIYGILSLLGMTGIFVLILKIMGC